MTFAEKLKALRLRRKLSQAKLAAASGLHANAVARLERGEREPSFRTACQLADALACKLDSLRPDPADLSREKASKRRTR